MRPVPPPPRWALPALLLTTAAVYLLAATCSPQTTDESEFVQATLWVAQGKLPFSGFWEHHAPLQWILFAPVGWLAGAANLGCLGTIRLLRFAQLPIVAAIGAAGIHFFRSASPGSRQWKAIVWISMLAFPTVVSSLAIYRQDTLGTCLFLAGVLLLERSLGSGKPGAWLLSGVAFSLAAQANLRFSLFAAMTCLVYAAANTTSPGPRAWVVLKRPQAWVMLKRLALLASGGVLGLVPLAVLFGPAGWSTIFYDLFTENKAGMASFGILPRLTGHIQANVFVLMYGILFLGEIYRGFRHHRLVSLATLDIPFIRVALIAMLLWACEFLQADPMPYHFVLIYVFLAWAAAIWIADPCNSNPKLRNAYPQIAICIAGLNLVALCKSWGVPTHQLAVQRAVGNHTVWTGLTPALFPRGRSYADHWFMPTHIHRLVMDGKCPGLDERAFWADPPEMVLAWGKLDLVLATTSKAFQAELTRTYIPLNRAVWTLGLNTRIDGRKSVTWTIPIDGDYQLVAVPAGHPWFTAPFHWNGPAIQLTPAPLPLAINGCPATRAHPTISLRRGATVSVANPSDQAQGVCLLRTLGEPISSVFQPTGQWW